MAANDETEDMHRSVSNAPLLFANMGQVKRISMWDQTCPESDHSTHAQSINSC